MFEEHDHQEKSYLDNLDIFQGFLRKWQGIKKKEEKGVVFPSFLMIYYSAIFNVTILFLIHWCQEWKIEGNIIFTEKFKVS